VTATSVLLHLPSQAPDNAARSCTLLDVHNIAQVS